MITYNQADLLARVQAALGRLAECQRDHSGTDPFEVLVNKVMNLHDYESLTQQAHATADIAVERDRAMAKKIARIADHVLLTTCIDIAAIALHVAGQISIEREVS